MAAGQERHPHDVHALPDRRRVPRPSPTGPATAARPVIVGPSRPAGVDRPRAARPRRERRPGAAGRDDRTDRHGRRRPDRPGAAPRVALRVSRGEAAAGASSTRDGGHARSARSAATLDLAFPAPCSGCGREGPPLCATCLPGARRAPRVCRAARRSGCRPTSRRRSSSSSGARRSRAPVRSALHDLKYAGERRLAEPLGAAVARRWAAGGIGRRARSCPVPVHADRERQRGYDQAALIAEVAARGARSARCVRALERRRATIAQFELGRDERAANVAGAFGVGPAAATGSRRSPAAGSCWSTTSSRPARRWRPARPRSVVGPAPSPSARSRSPASGDDRRGRPGRRRILGRRRSTTRHSHRRSGPERCGQSPGGYA